MRIVFPTKENMSYISHTTSLSEADYLTILQVRGQNITEVETVKNCPFSDNKAMVDSFKSNHYGVVIAPDAKSLPTKALKDVGISVFEDAPSHLVLEAFSEFVQDRLIRV